MDDEALCRFAAAVEILAPEWVADSRPMLIALSGGADSTALLWLAHRHFGTRIRAMTVDHQLRPEAADEAKQCAALCERLGIPHVIATPRTPIDGNIQSAARAARYALLENEAEAMSGALVATAHHADDQLETVMMRLARGSGVAGLAGIRARNGRVIRPLLGFSKAELTAICRAAAIDWIEDPSNQDTDYDRVRMREALAKADLPISAQALGRSSKALADAEEALRYAADSLFDARVEKAGDEWSIDARGLPHELIRRLMISGLEAAGEAVPRGATLDHAIAALERGEKCSIGGMIATGGEKWHFTPAPPRNGAKSDR